MKVCTNCGARNQDTAAFCAECDLLLRRPDRNEATQGQSPTPTPRPLTPNPPSPPPVLPGQPDRATQQELFQAAVDGLQRGRQLAVDHDRNDLAGALDHARATLTERAVGVAVVGEFKRGKSTLINALLQTAVCPVDADQVTVVPTMVRYGDTRSAIAYLENSTPLGSDPDPGSDEPRTVPVPVEQIAAYVSEAGNPGNRRGLRSVEVRLPHRILRTGLCLIDTPGVGGLDSAHGILTLGTLSIADGMLFLTDASQELTEPELDFLRQALDRCPVAACVVTKTDLYPGWRQIVALDEKHLRGLDVPVIPVSSYLRLASADEAVTEESGYLVLADFLATTVMRNANASAVVDAARDVEFAAGQIGAEINAEETVLREPAKAERVIAQLAAAQVRTAELASSTATWQQMLTDGVEDLFAQVAHDLQERLRAVLHDVKEIIDARDPKDSWDDIEAWLRQRVVADAVENYDLLADRTRELAGRVGESFNLDDGGPGEPEPGTPSERVAQVHFPSVRGLTPPGGRFGAMLMATRTSLFPMALFGVVGSVVGAFVAAPVLAAIGGLIGLKMIHGEKERQVAYRRQQANLAAHQYVEEVGFIMNKESRDALRRTQRFLRDYFQRRATTLHRSSSTALQAAQRAKALSEPERARRVSQLAVDGDQLRVVTGNVSQLVAMAAPGGAGTGG